MTLVLALEDGETLAAARRLGDELGVPVDLLEARRFPDGESLVRAPRASPTTILYGSLDDPDRKLVRLILAAAALRDLGARRLVLVAPYLCYMRQDRAFRRGEAVSQRVIGRLLAERLDRLVTVDPHLHRTATLSEAGPWAEADALTAAPALRAAMASDGGAPPLLVGPDAESARWVEAIAEPAGLETMVATKVREGDRRVRVSLPDAERARGRRVVIVDDVVSSGATLVALAGILRDAGAQSIEALVTHALHAPETAASLRAAGVKRLRATDSIAGAGRDALPLAPLLAEALAKETRS